MDAERAEPAVEVGHASGARLQLRWAPAPADVRQRYGEDAWLCHYELVVPLGAVDDRARGKGFERVREELVVTMFDPQVRIPSEGVIPCASEDEGASPFYDPPFLGGIHADRDCEALRQVRVVVIAPDGTVIERPGV